MRIQIFGDSLISLINRAHESQRFGRRVSRLCAMRQDGRWMLSWYE